MQKKTIKWATKPLIKKEKKEKERARKKDRNRFAKKIWLLRMREKQKMLFNYVRLAENAVKFQK